MNLPRYRTAISLAWFRYGPMVVTCLIYIILAAGAFYDQSYGIPESWPSDEESWVSQRMIEQNTLDPSRFFYPGGPFIYITFLFTKIALPMTGGNLPSTVLHVARSVNAIFFLLTVFVVQKTIQLACKRNHTPFTVLFIGSSLALIHHAHLATVNSGAFFSIALALYAFVRTIVYRREIDFYLSVGACSLAAAFKYNSIFLFAALPLVWILTFGSVIKRQFVINLGVSLLLAPLPFLLTNPYLLLDFNTAKSNIVSLFFVEAPAFQSATSVSDKIVLYWDRLLNYSYGFFTVPVFIILIITLVFWIVFNPLLFFRTGERGTILRRDFAIRYKVMLVLAWLFGLQTVTNFDTGIFQSRYFIPGLFFVAVAFLVALYGLRDLFANDKGFTYWQIRLAQWSLAGAMAICAVFAAINGYAHVASFDLAPKVIATNYVLSKVQDHPTIRIGVIGYGSTSSQTRSPFQRGLPSVEPHLDVFMTMRSPESEDIDTWDAYLASIQKFFRERSPQYIVAEDIIFNWTVFLPKKYAADYGKRLLFPNPGYDAWRRMLQGIGYTRVAVLSYPNRDWFVNALIGTYYAETTEGVGGNVYIFEKK